MLRTTRLNGFHAENFFSTKITSQVGKGVCARIFSVPDLEMTKLIVFYSTNHFAQMRDEI